MQHTDPLRVVYLTRTNQRCPSMKQASVESVLIISPQNMPTLTIWMYFAGWETICFWCQIVKKEKPAFHHIEDNHIIKHWTSWKGLHCNTWQSFSCVCHVGNEKIFTTFIFDWSNLSKWSGNPRFLPLSWFHLLRWALSSWDIYHDILRERLNKHLLIRFTTNFLVYYILFVMCLRALNSVWVGVYYLFYC